MSSGQTVAVVGAGAAGLGAAWLLSRGGRSVTVFESHTEPGGHARTIGVPLPGNPAGARVQVDVGFMVYNTKTYPDLVSLFEMLDVEQENSNMSFASSVETASGGVFEWGSDGLSTLFADRANIVRPSMYAMLWDMRRFNRSVHQYVERVTADAEAIEAKITLGEFLDDGGYTHAFISYYIIPMVSAVWSAPLRDALAFPAVSLFHFFVNHGLVQVFARPQWRTPAGRSRSYVNRLVEDMCAHGAKMKLGTAVTKVVRDEEGVLVYTDNDEVPARFNQVVFATHAPTTLRILGESATDDERRILGAFRYSKNASYVHHDMRLMPRNEAVWSSWNFISRKPQTLPTASQDHEQATPPEQRPVCVTYWLNRLQNLNRYAMDVPNIFVTLNPVMPIDESKVLAECTFDHPQFTLDSIQAQNDLPHVIQGKHQSWFCGAYARYGFHEDALMTGLDVAERMMDFRYIRPWRAKPLAAMNNNYRVYEVPFSGMRTPTLFFICALAVINAVIYRLTRAMTKISKMMTDDDPAVIVAAGDGTLRRFGPRGAPVIAGHHPINGEVVLKGPARITVRNAKFFARVADWLRRGYDLAPIIAASFSAREIDSPTAQDLSQALCAMFVAQMRNNGLTEGSHGQMRLAEKLIFAFLGQFEKLTPPPTQSRLRELSTAVTGVVYPAWWRFAEDAQVADNASESPVTGSALDESATRRLELVGELCAATIDALQADRGNTATIVVANSERLAFMREKAELLGVEGQVTVIAAADFISSHTPAEKYGLITSPAAVNIAEGLFGSLAQLMSLTRTLLSDTGTVEFGFASYSATPSWRARRRRHLSDAVFCGDRGFRVWPEQEVLDAAGKAGLGLVRVTQMKFEEAAGEVKMATHRVLAGLAMHRMADQEIRNTTSQLCLWEAALRSRYLSRTAALLRPR